MKKSCTLGKGRVTNEKQTSGSPGVKGDVEFVWEGGVGLQGSGVGQILYPASQEHNRLKKTILPKKQECVKIHLIKELNIFISTFS